MTPPRSVEEWATYCHTESHWIAWSAGQGGAEKILCINCARAYAAAQVAQARGEEQSCWFVWTLGQDGRVVLRGVYLSQEKARIAKGGAEHEKQWVRTYVEQSKVNHLYGGSMDSVRARGMRG